MFNPIKIKHIFFQRKSFKYFYVFLFCVNCIFCVKTNSLKAQNFPSGFISITGPTLLCENSVGYVTFDAVSGTAPFTFVYSVNGVVQPPLVSPDSNISVSYTNVVGAFSFNLMSIQDANYGPIAQSGTATMTFYPLPVAIVGGVNDTICPDGGMATVPSATAANGTITWSENGAGYFSSGANTLSPTYIATLADAGKTRTITLIVSSNNVCSQSNPPATATYSIPVRNTISVSKQVPASVCKDGNATMVYRATNGTPPYTFNYTVDGVVNSITTIGTNNQAAMTGISSVVGGHTYNLISVQDAHCSQAIPSSPQSFSVYPLPVISVVGDPKACRDEDPWPVVVFKTDVKTVSPYKVLYTINADLKDTISLNTAADGYDSLRWPHSTAVTGIFTYSLLTVIDGRGCRGTIDRRKSVVKILERPNARFVIDPQMAPNLRPNINFTNTSAAATGYLWDFGDGTLSPMEEPGEYVYKDTGTFKIKLMAFNDICVDSTFQYVLIYMPFTLYTPSAFSPNGDGVNDIFTPKADGFLAYNIKIYDRWGIEVFESDNINKGWDGILPGGKEPAQMDTFVYVINIIAIDLKTYIYYGMVSIAPK